MGIEEIHHLYGIYDELLTVHETKVTSMTAKTPEPPSEPDLFDEDKLEADEAEADFDAEETNKKETE
jgi:hypothetical protein